LLSVRPRTIVQPDARHRFALDHVGDADRVRLDVYPDGGLARLRIYGELTPEALAGLADRWHNTAPTD